MKTTYRLSLPAVLFTASVVFAQNAAPAGAPSREREKPPEQTVSRETSAAVLAGYRYQPPKPVEPKNEDDVDLRDVDKPRNEIIRLPRYVVEATRPAVFKERNLYTPEMLKKIAAQRYLGMGQGLNSFQLGRSGENVAQQMYWDDERLKNMTEGERHVSLYRIGGDEARASKAEEQNRSTYIRVDNAGTKEISQATGQRY
jgi:hypothetical protein